MVRIYNSYKLIIIFEIYLLKKSNNHSILLSTGDLITLFDSADLAAAIAYSRVLKLTLFVNGKIIQSTGHGIIASSKVDPKIIQELRVIRDKVNQVLDVLGDRSVPITENALQVKSAQHEMTNGEHAEIIADSEKSLQDLKLESKEFDPLQRSQFVVNEPPAVPFTVGNVIPEDQQSVSSSASANKGEVPAPPALTPVTSGTAPVQAAPPLQQTYPAAAYPGMPVNQQQPGAPAMSPMPPIYPGYTPTSVPGQLPGGPQPQQVPGQLPGGHQPQQVPQSSHSQHPQQPNQMSAFVGFPQQAAQQPPAAPRPTSAGPQPTTQQPQNFYPPPQRPQGMPMPGNPYGMGQRGPTPGFRYPQPGQGYR